MATAGEFLRVCLHYSQPSAGDIQNVFHFRLGGSVGTDAQLLTDVTAWVSGLWLDQWRQLASDQTVLSHWESDIVTPGGFVTRNIGGNLVGTEGDRPSEVLSAASAYYMLAYTAVPKARGSKYVPGLSEEDSSGGAISVAMLAELAILLGTYLTVFTASSGTVMTPGVLSAVLGAFVPFINSGAIDNLCAYQRRRKAGVGI